MGKSTRNSTYRNSVRKQFSITTRIPLPYSRETGKSHEIFISTYFFILQYTSLNIFFPIPWNRFTSNEGLNKDNVCVCVCVCFNFYPLIFGCARSSSLHMGSLQLCRVGATLHCGVWASHCYGFSCGTWAPGSWASVVVAHGLRCPTACGIFPDQGFKTHVPCIGRWILNHWTTRKVKG